MLLMANPYSYDLRQKVIQALELNGMKKSVAAQVFGISRNTIDLWRSASNRNWRLQSKRRNSHPEMDTLITDWEKFRAFAAQHGDSFRQKWQSNGRGQISVRTISRALHKIGFTRKKRRMATLNAPEAKRQAFVEQLAVIPISQRVYVDEAGMDNRSGVRLWLESALENAFMHSKPDAEQDESI